SHTLGTCLATMRLVTVQSKHNLMIPEQRSLNLFTKNPPKNVPPPPAEAEAESMGEQRQSTLRHPHHGKSNKAHRLQLCYSRS
uniref:Uncharacterized protein n=1 Tax=Chelydra serpentina TaxID=8475 RepID=A0A8C3RQN4_CHESE